MSTQTKTCSKCKKVKPASKFGADKSLKSGLKSRCKSCCVQANAETYARKQGVEIPYKRPAVSISEKYCFKCDTVKDKSTFGNDRRSPDGLNCWCKACTTQVARDRYARVNKNTASSLAQKHYFSMASLKTKYNIDEAGFQSLMNQQKGCCKICGRDFSTLSTRAAVDHDHCTGEVRGLLCTRCNTFIGHIELEPRLLHKVNKYLIKD